MRTVLLFASLAVAPLASCVRPVSDPNAVAPNYDRWQATVAGSPARTFDVAMRVLADSSYRIADARKDAGIIRTEYRKASEVERGAKQLRLMVMANDYPVRLALVFTPTGSDSTRIDLTGEYQGSPSVVIPINARAGGWPYVRGIGEAILGAAR